MSAFGDVVILLPGITGSALANKKGKEVWGTTGGAIIGLPAGVITGPL